MQKLSDVMAHTQKPKENLPIKTVGIKIYSPETHEYKITRISPEEGLQVADMFQTRNGVKEVLGLKKGSVGGVRFYYEGGSFKELQKDSRIEPRFKVQYGYNKEQYYPLTDKAEVLKALKVQIRQEGTLLTRHGSVRAKDIISVSYDHEAMLGYDIELLPPEDRGILNEATREASNLLTAWKEEINKPQSVGLGTGDFIKRLN